MLKTDTNKGLRKPASNDQLVSKKSQAALASSLRRCFMQIQWAHFITVLIACLYAELAAAIALLNWSGWLRPQLYAVFFNFNSAFVNIITFVVVVTAVFVKGANFFPVFYFKEKQALYAVLTSSLMVLVVACTFLIQPPRFQQPVLQPSFTAIPYYPYKGIPLLNVMQPAITKTARYAWETSSDRSGSCTFIGQDYHIVATTRKEGAVHVCGMQNASFRNFAFEANITFLQKGEAGILFRNTVVNGNYVSYDLALESYGYVYLYVYSPSGAIVKLMEKAIYHFDRSLGHTNQLAVSVDGQAIYVYVNGDLQGRAINDTASQGSISVYTGLPQDQVGKQVEVIYSDARAWKL